MNQNQTQMKRSEMIAFIKENGTKTVKGKTHKFYQFTDMCGHSDEQLQTLVNKIKDHQ